MNKENQSLLDFIRMLPFYEVNVQRSPISNKEAESLFEIWKSDRDENGKTILPNNVDPIQVANLTSKGLIKTLYSTSYWRTIDFTPKGKEIIRNIILLGEKSNFEQNKKKFNYSKIHATIASKNKSWLDK